MATQPIPVLKETFSDNKEPNGQDFGNLIDSFDHKSIPLPQARILGLQQSFDEKANKDDVTLSLLYLPSVETHAKLYTEYPTPKNGEASLVLDEGYIYQFRTDINDWVKTPFKSFPDDIVTSEELQREANQYKANIFDKNGLRFGKIINTTSKNIVDANVNNTVAVTGFYIVPDWAQVIFVYSHEGDALPANIIARFSNETTDTGDAEILSLANAETVGKAIPVGYKYVCVTVVRNSTAGFVPDLNNIFIGFSENYKTQQIADDLIPEPEKDADLRFISLDFNCFEVYKTDRSDVLTNISNLYASQILGAILEMELNGYDISKKYKASLIRRNYGTALDYSIIIGVYDGSNWVRDSYFSSTGVDIEASNPNGINVFEKSLPNGKSIRAVIDYSKIPMGASVMVDRTENAEPNYIIKDSCFYKLDDNYATKQEAVKDVDLSISESRNLADPKYIINDKYIANNGYIYNGVGWKMIAIFVKALIDYSFGNFKIDSGGYSAFYDNSGNLVQYNGAYTTGTLPRTYTAPVDGILYIVIKRPTNSELDYAEMMINEGTPLPYEPLPEVLKIRGYPIGADTIEIEEQISDIQKSINDLYSLLPQNDESEKYRSKTALSLELSISDGSNVKSSQAYIDSITKAITVK